MSQAPKLRLTRVQALMLAAIAIIAGAIAVMPAPALHPKAMFGFAIVFVTVTLFATGILPGLYAAIVFFILATLSGAADPLALASGFWANATMLAFGGLIIGAAAERSGLGRYVARGLVQRFLGSYPRLLFGLMVGNGVLSFLLPSTMGRLAITIPIVMGIVKEAGYVEGSKGYIGIFLMTVAGNFLTSFAILPANLSNVIVLGAAETLYGPQTTYAEYLLLCGPVMGLVKALFFWALVQLLFPADAPMRSHTEAVPLGQPARRLAVVLAFMVGLWATDFLHGIKPGWVALGAALLCLLPPVSLVGLRESFDFNRISAVIILPAVLGLATVITQSGAGDEIAAWILAVVPLEGQSPAYGFASVVISTALASVVSTIVGCVAIMTPLLDNVAAATALPVKLGMIAELMGLQTVFLPYQAVPIMVGLAMARLSPLDGMRLLIPLAVGSLMILLPLQILWLKVLGMLP